MAEKRGFTLGTYVVCIIDVLGQKARLATWGNLPFDGTLTPDYQQALKKTVGTVLAFQETFERYFAGMQRGNTPTWPGRISEKDQAFLKRLKSCRLKVQQFSDTFVFYSPLANEHGDLSTVQLFQILGACCTAMLVSLAAHVPVRGGIALGPGIEIDEGRFYGPALAEAHHIESEVAQFPRVVVSDHVLQYLRFVRDNASSSTVAAAMERLAGGCRGVLVQDDDRKWIVDYMGATMREHFGQDSKFAACASEAYQFVRAEERRLIREKNNKLVDRYHKLRQYIESRMYLWTDAR